MTPNKYCPRLDSYCQYRRTEYCQWGKVQELPEPPECKNLAHKAVEESMESENIE